MADDGVVFLVAFGGDVVLGAVTAFGGEVVAFGGEIVAFGGEVATLGGDVVVGAVTAFGGAVVAFGGDVVTFGGAVVVGAVVTFGGEVVLVAVGCVDDVAVGGAAAVVTGIGVGVVTGCCDSADADVAVASDDPGGRVVVGTTAAAEIGAVGVAVTVVVAARSSCWAVADCAAIDWGTDACGSVVGAGARGAGKTRGSTGETGAGGAYGRRPVVEPSAAGRVAPR